MKNKPDEKLNQRFLVKTGFMGLLVFLLFMGATPAKAHQVIEGAIPVLNAEYFLGVKYRSFGNSPDPQALIGLTLLGGVNQFAGKITWSNEQKNFFKFTYDPNKGIKGIISTIIFRMDPSYKSSISTFEIPSATLKPDVLSMMKISIACGDPGAKVALKNVKLNGTPLIPFDDFMVAYPNLPKDWTVKGFDFKNGFAVTGEIVLTGTFGAAPDASYIALDVGFKKTNAAPVCTGAKPDPATLWPPNHDFHPIKIGGVTDPDGDSVSLSVTRILQDEPLNGPGDGDFSPDGSGIDRPKAWVRSERAGGQNGRVYHIYFRADDGFGGTCSAVVKVGVPKSQGGNGGPVDGGPIYNSTLHSLSFSPKFLRFLFQEAGTPSIRQIVTMTNVGPTALDHLDFAASGPFAIAENQCGSTLPAGDTCTFAVTFTPPNEGIFKGSVRVTSSAADSPQILGLWGMGGYLLLAESQGIFREGDWYFDNNQNSNWDGDNIDKHLGKFGGYSFDIPVIGDWNGDGEKKIGIYRHGAWYLDYNGNGEWDGCGVDSCISAFGGFPWDIPVVGDWNGDGKTKIGIYRSGVWYLDKNGNGIWDGCAVDACIPAFGGLDIDKPIIGDWDGSGRSRIGIYRQGFWYLDMNGNGEFDGCEIDACFGPYGGFDMDKPVVGDWKGDGIPRIGIYRQGSWYLDLNGNGKWDGVETDLCTPAFGGFAIDYPIVK